jgi:two-component system response regulator DesR
MIRVLLAEDQAMVRQAIAGLLNLEEDMQVVAEVGRGDQVVTAASETRPDVALLDIEMPGMSGLEALSRLRAEIPECRVLIVTTFGRVGYLQRAMSSGAAGFLLKDAPIQELTRAIRRAVAGERTVDPGLAAAALAEGGNPLTHRELEVLQKARLDLSIAEMAEELHLSPGTTRNYLSVIMQKLGARSRAEAVHVAEEKGWL